MKNELSKEELILLIEKLRAENVELKEKLYGKRAVETTKIDTSIITQEEKIKIFTSLFKARTDVYAKRWESIKTGKSGYSPVCANDFNKFKCDRTKVKCSECINRELVPLTEEVILKHLTGNVVIGIYPLLPGDLCNFLAIDFDESTYEKDVSAFRGTCFELKIPVYVERSRSGNGAHVWIFFEEEMPARLARKLGMILLTKTMDRMAISLNSYDRLFPNQDTMPKGGFGNLIALPFQGEAAKKGNTVFVDEYFEKYENQIEMLREAKRISKEQVITFMEKYGQDDYPEPVNTEDEDNLPKEINSKEILFENDIECIFDNQIYIKKIKLLPNEITYLKRLASFTNPKFYELQKLRMPVYSTPRIVKCFEEDERYLILPRGCMDEIVRICDKSKRKLKIKDIRQEGLKINYKFNGKLNEKQERAMQELIKYETGILSATTGFGKTVIAAKIIAELKTNVLVIVHRQQLLSQWKERLSLFLNIDKKAIGQIGGGKNKPNKQIDIAVLQTLYKKEDINSMLDGYGLVIVDECHHISAFSFEQVLKKIRARHVYGLTATPIRKDGHHPIIYMQCGDIRHKVSSRQLKSYKEMEHNVIIRYTEYRYVASTDENERIVFANILNDMANSQKRNEIIVNDIKVCIENGKTPIVLSERVEHLMKLKEMLKKLNVLTVIYKGRMGKKEMASMEGSIKEADESGLPRIILATSSCIGEGFDDSKLDTLFMTMPISWKGRILQYVGRLHREHINKDKVEVYDYVDDMKMLTKMYNKRLKGYKAAGYTVIERDEHSIYEYIKENVYDSFK